jgi:UDP-N-acetylmuramoylalanine--D-glutamate ligase
MVVLTSLFPDHLPWHGSIEQYYRDKLRLFVPGTSQRGLANWADPGVRSIRASGDLDSAELYAAPDSVIRVEHGVVVVHDTPAIPLARCRLAGDHNAANVAGAVAVLAATGIDVAAEASRLEAALAAFSPLPHRLEVVASIQGVMFVDDSLATTPQAAIAACEAFADRSLALLVGGADRGVDYAPLVSYLESRAATSLVLVLAMGPAGRRVAASLDAVEALVCDDVAEAVSVGADVLPAGHDGVVLLSPAAASPASYGSYRDRSRAFRAGVERLQQRL